SAPCSARRSAPSRPWPTRGSAARPWSGRACPCTSNGEWNNGGNCVRTRPLRRGKCARDAMVAEFHAAHVDTLRKTEAASQQSRNGVEMRLLDITEAMELRPDWHLSRY
uniref:Trichome birefringence-like C-terminal domain-containing protein n=1 Tax=Triticum urartu TaxID=4572 RepID=A0A8R7UTL1_TRIUA